MKKLVLFLITFLVLLSAKVLATIEISDCSTLDQENEIYLLTADITNSADNMCMIIGAPNIVLDCQNYLIDADSGSYGVYDSSYRNITIENCAISNWQIAGARFERSGNNHIINSTIENNLYGVYLKQSGGVVSNANITSSSFISNIFGIYIIDDEGTFTFVNDSTFTNNGVAIYSEGYDNYFYNNLFNGTNYMTCIACLDYYNTTLQNGTAIYTSGSEIGGNYYTNPTHTGFSDTCTNASGFCDSSYEVVSDRFDYLPLSKLYVAPNCNINMTFSSDNWSTNTTNYYLEINATDKVWIFADNNASLYLNDVWVSNPIVGQTLEKGVYIAFANNTCGNNTQYVFVSTPAVLPAGTPAGGGPVGSLVSQNLSVASQPTGLFTAENLGTFWNSLDIKAQLIVLVLIITLIILAILKLKWK
jgi:hypothetical protein